MRDRAWIAALACAVVGAAAAAPPASPYGFEFRIDLTPAAAERLAARHEGITASASWYGEPTPAAQQHADEAGHIDLGVEQVSLPGRAGPVRISGAQVERARLAWIQGPVKVNVNVYSSRHSDPDNVLGCDFIDGDVATLVKAEPVVLHCGLMSERPDTRMVP